MQHTVRGRPIRCCRNVRRSTLFSVDTRRLPPVGGWAFIFIIILRFPAGDRSRNRLGAKITYRKEAKARACAAAPSDGFHRFLLWFLFCFQRPMCIFRPSCCWIINDRETQVNFRYFPCFHNTNWPISSTAVCSQRSLRSTTRHHSHRRHRRRR